MTRILKVTVTTVTRPLLRKPVAGFLHLIRRTVCQLCKNLKRVVIVTTLAKQKSFNIERVLNEILIKIAVYFYHLKSKTMLIGRQDNEAVMYYIVHLIFPNQRFKV